MSNLVSDIQALLESHRQMNLNYHGRPDCKSCSLMEDMERLLGAEINSRPPKPTQNKQLFESLCKALGHTNLKYTPGRAAKLRQRLRTFSADDILQAAQAIAQNDYMMGDNPSGKKYGTVDYLLRNDEKLDEWLESSRGNTVMDLSRIEI